MDYDKIIEHVGEFGKYHKRVYVLVCLPAILVAMHMLSYVFNSAVPDHRCFIDDCDNSSTSFQEDWLNYTIPINKEKRTSNFKFSQCVKYNVMPNKSPPFCPPPVNLSQRVSCSKWKYDESVYEETVVTKWNLVCEHGWQAPLSGSLWMFGVILGAVVFGDLSDRFGRRMIIMISILLCTVTAFIVPFSINYEMFLGVRVILAAASTGIYQTAFVLGLETVGQSKRVFCGIGISIAFALGEVILGGLAYFIRDWRQLQFNLALPGVFFLFYFWLLPESVRWLIAQRRYREAKQIIKKMAVTNKTSVPLELLDDEDDDCSCIESTSRNEAYTKKASAINLFQTPRLRWRTLNIFLNWFMNTIGYYGISMNATNLQGDVYLDFILTSAVEIPAYIFCLLVLDRMGRKKPLILCMVIGGLSCILAILVPDREDYKWFSIGLSLIGKFGCAAAFAIIYVFSIELFPTVLRNNGIGLSSFFAHIGGIIAPYIASLSEYGRAIPLLIFGSSSLLAGLMAIFLPETLGKKLPQTIEDAENFGRFDRKYEDSESEILIKNRIHRII